MAGQKVLIIDDEPEVAASLGGNLNLAGFEVTEAHNGIEALGLMSVHRYDGIITDLNMPEIDGLQLISYIKANKKNAKTTIFVVSGDLDEGNLVKIKELGVVDWVKKPVDIADIETKLKVVLSPNPVKVLAYHPDMVAVLERSFREVLEFYCEGEVEQGVLSLKGKDKDQDHSNYSCLIGIFGRFCYGSLMVSFSEGLLLHLGQTLFGISDIDGVEDLLGEMTNQIAGKLKTFLNEKEVLITIGLPHPVAKGNVGTHLISGRIGILRFKIASHLGFLEFCLDSGARHSVQESTEFPVFVTEKALKIA